MSDRAAEVRRLRRRRPRNRFLRWSLGVTALLVAAAWIIGPRDPDRPAGAVTSQGFRFSDLFSADRTQKLNDFVQTRLRPYPVRTTEWDWAVVGDWARDLWIERGYEATMMTLAIAVAAIVLAGMLGLLAALPAARNLASPQPFIPNAQPPVALHRAAWRGVVFVSRAILIFARAIPEYIWAFLLLTLLGPTAWPAVLALGLHNAGILGKLGAEVVENVEPAVPRAVRALGASRGQVAAFSLFPQLLPRFLLFFFYRWETCVREATVLGMLGFATLGFHIRESRARLGYDDELIYFALLGAGLVLAGDFISFICRRMVRRTA